MRPRFLLWALVPCLLAAQSVSDLQKAFEKKVTEFTLANGMHFIVIERHDAPVVSFHTYLNVGSVDDPGGQTGLAHMFEHMAFKGTSAIGTKNWVAEKAALAAVERVYDRLEAERAKGNRADAKRLEALQMELAVAIEKADSFVEENEYDRVVESNGGADMNARLDYAFKVALARAPRPEERTLMTDYCKQQTDAYRAKPEDATKLLAVGESKPDPALDPVELATWTTMASMLLNLDEAVTKE